MVGEPGSPRRVLLDSLVEHFVEHGIGDSSMRAMAAAVSTSHRMLSYHFGSRDGVLVAVSQRVEAEQRAALSALLNDGSLTPEQVMWQAWDRLADPTLWPQERLFYELYIRALQGDEQARPFLDGAVTAWLAPLERLFARLPLPPEQVPAEARLALAFCRGLLLDLLATEDRAAADAVMRQYLRRYAH